MALLFMDGFDAGDPQIKNWSGTVTTANSSPNPRFSVGRYAATTGLFQRTITPSAEIIVGVSMGASLVTGVVCPYITFFGDSGATQHITVGFSGTVLQVMRGGLAGTVLASYSSIFLSATFYHIEISVTIADAGGSVVVRSNGVTVISFSGDTKNGGTGTNIDAVGCGVASGVTGLFDDIYICDTTGSAPYNAFLGDVRVHTMSPSAAGTTTQFTPSSGANYTTVDELPYSATDYVAASSTTLKDTYQMSDLPAGAATIFAVQTNLIAKKTDAGNIAIKPVVRSGGTDYSGASTALISSDLTISHLRVQDPATSTAWTAAGVNGMEAGVEIA